MINNNPMQFLMQMMNMGNNPNAILNVFMQQNPNARAIYQSVMNSGMTPSQYLNQYAKQNGLENQVNQMMSFINNKK